MSKPRALGRRGLPRTSQEPRTRRLTIGRLSRDFLFYARSYKFVAKLHMRSVMGWPITGKTISRWFFPTFSDFSLFSIMFSKKNCEMKSFYSKNVHTSYLLKPISISQILKNIYELKNMTMNLKKCTLV